MYGAGIMATAVLTLLTPWIAYTGLVPFIIIRILEGIFEVAFQVDNNPSHMLSCDTFVIDIYIIKGVTFPAMHSLWSRWAPPLERSKLVTAAYSGSYFGTVISMVVCGLLAEHFGWPSIFYTFGNFLFHCCHHLACFHWNSLKFLGVVALIWCFLWFLLVKECPQEDRVISSEELDYINACLGSTSNQHVISESLFFPAVTFLTLKIFQALVIPWKAILTSLPVWATVIAHFAENWGFYTMLTQLPTFLSGKCHW